ncbi:MAG: hypothetical protein AAFX81_12215 [Pseudomonadota bacterium]
MRTVERFEAAGFFSGERRYTLRSLPPGSTVRSARFTITPVRPDATDGLGIDRERVRFDPGDAPGFDDLDPDRRPGVQKTVSVSPPHWVEIAFQGRRIAEQADAVAPLVNALSGATFQIDLGGVFVRVNARGTIAANGDPDFTIPDNIPTDGASLPAIAAARMRLWTPAPGTTAIDLNRLTLRAVASNLRLTVGGVESAFVSAGDLLTEIETPDLADVVQLAVDEATAAGGAAAGGSLEIPVTLTVDGTARLTLSAEIEFDEVVEPLGEDLAEAKLEFGVAGAPAAADDLLQLMVPAGKQLAANGTSIDLIGRFDGSEVVLGPLVERAPPGRLSLAAGTAVAQPFALTEETEVNAIDLLLATDGRQCGLQCDVRADQDGKPSPESILTEPVSLQITDARFASPGWASVRLARALTLAAAAANLPRKRWWLVVQAVEGAATLSVGEAKVPDPVAPQTSGNGGLSWRPAEIDGTASVPEIRLRLRRESPAFKVPVKVEIGRDAEAELVSLDDFQPLGRVDFAFGGTRLTGPANKVVAKKRAAACPRGEQLENGDFADREGVDGSYVPGGWISDGNEPIVRFVTSAISTTAGGGNVLALTGPDPSSLSQLLVASPGCTYELIVAGFRVGEDARAELIWRRGDCGVARVDVLVPHQHVPVFDGDDVPPPVTVLAVIRSVILHENRLRVTAPDDATRLELRLLAVGETAFVLDSVSLQATPTGLANAGFRDAPKTPATDPPELPGWQLDPPEALAPRPNGFEASQPVALDIDFASGIARLENVDAARRTVRLTQRVEAVAAADVSLELHGRVDRAIQAGAPTVSLSWEDADANAVGPALTAEIVQGGGGLTRLAAPAPAMAAALAVAIELAPGAVLNVGEVTLRQEAVTTLPLSFLSEASGNLTIRNFKVAFEPAPSPPTETPAGGLCQPTPADSIPGDDCEADPCCSCAKPTEQQMQSPAAISMIRPGSAVTFNARTRLAAERLALTRGIERERDHRLTIRGEALIEPAIEITTVTEVGEARASALREIGITSPRQLAMARPDALVRRLGFAPQLAARLVQNARSLIASRRIR